MNKIIACLFTLFFSTNMFSAAINTSHDVANDLCSTEGLMRLVPQLKNKDGTFQIPDSSKDPKAFLSVHTALTNIIEMALTQALMNGNPYQVSNLNMHPLTFGTAWRSAEVGLQTDGQALSFPDNQKFASYGGVSFMSGITPLEQGAGYYYSIRKPNKTIPALVYVQPTILPCVNRVDLAAANTVGSWLTPTYALGTIDGQAYLVIDKCLDLGSVMSENGKHYLIPNAILFTAMHWADLDELKHMRTTQKGHVH